MSRNMNPIVLNDKKVEVKGAADASIAILTGEKAA
jgi:hypothetical protein